MQSIQLNYHKAYKWYSEKQLSVKGYLFDKDNHLYEKERLLSYFEGVSDVVLFEEKLKNANGLFSVVIQHENTILVGTDITRTFPLFYAKQKDTFYLYDNPYFLAKQLNETINLLSEEEFLSAGYISGSETLINNLYQLQAAELINVSADNAIYKKKYSDYLSYQTTTSSFEVLHQKLVGILDRLSFRLIKIANGRKIIIPLSGGYDSRIIAAMLRKHNYENVLCFTYGKKNSFEAEIAQRVAKTLNYQWVFVEYNQKNINENYLLQPENWECAKYLSNLVTMPHSQTYIALKYLLKNELIDKNSFFVPGHTGDFLAGKHFFKTIISNKKNIIRNIIEKHYKLNSTIISDSIKEKIKKELTNTQNSKVYSVDENWNLKERQAKFIINSNKIFEFHNYQHALPLWDKELVDFFKEIPLKYKIKKNLYDFTLHSIFDNLTIGYRKNKSQLIRQNPIIFILKNTIKKFVPSQKIRKLKSIIKKNQETDINNFSSEKENFSSLFMQDVQQLDINYIYAKVFLDLFKTSSLEKE